MPFHVLFPVSVLFVVFLLAGPLAGHVAGQQGGSGEDTFRSWPHGELLWKPTRVAGRSRSLLGATFGFGLTPRTSVGGAGFQLTGRVLLGSPTDLHRTALDFGYGGLVVERLAPSHRSWALAASLLLGAGHATARRDGVELGSDNFGVLEPTISIVRALAGPLGVRVGGGYRFVFGVDDLDGVRPSDLRGATLLLGLRLTGR